MNKLKRFFILLFCCILCVNFTFLLTSCKKNELKKVSKNLSSYAISVSLDESFVADCSETIDYVNTASDDLSFVCFHLYPRAFREDAIFKPYTTLTLASCFPNGISYGDIEINSVKVNSEEAEFKLIGEDEDILKVEFGFLLKAKASVKIEIKFNLKIPNCTHRLGYYDGNINLGNWYPIACVYENGEFDMTPYYATGDPFYSEISNYLVDITYPSKYVLCSTGEAVLTEIGEETTAIISAAAVRDFAICLSENSAVVKTVVGDTTIFYMGYDSDTDIQVNLTLASDVVAYFNKTFGEYPYSTLSICKTPFIYGGMEYPNLVFISDSIDSKEENFKVIVHEIAHQWWYGIVGNNETCEAWLDESLAEYSVALFFENNAKYSVDYDEIVSSALSSYLLYVDVISTIRGDVITNMNLPVYKYQNDYEYSYMIYVKGVIMFDELKKVVGESKLIAGLKKYYEENKFKIATTESFLDAFETACHKDLRQFFKSYLNGEVIISSIN